MDCASTPGPRQPPPSSAADDANWREEIVGVVCDRYGIQPSALIGESRCQSALEGDPGSASKKDPLWFLIDAAVVERHGAVGGVAFHNGLGGLRSDPVFEAPALVTGLDDVAVMGEPVEERRGHLGVAED